MWAAAFTTADEMDVHFHYNIGNAEMAKWKWKKRWKRKKKTENMKIIFEANHGQFEVITIYVCSVAHKRIIIQRMYILLLSNQM